MSQPSEMEDRILQAIKGLSDKVVSLESKLDVSLRHMCVMQFKSARSPIVPGTFRPCFTGDESQVHARGRQAFSDRSKPV